jgi:hypothetical protein
VTIRRATATALLLAATACSSSGQEAGTDPPTLQPREGTTTSTEPAPAPIAGSLDVGGLGEPHVGPVTFDLPTDCSVPVTEARVESSGLEVDIDYDLTFSSEGANVVVAMDDVVVQRAVTQGREVPAALVPPAIVTRATVVVGPDATVVEVRGIDELLGLLPDVPPDALPIMEQTFRVDAVDKAWDVWFGTWVGWGSFTGPTEESVTAEVTPDEQTHRMESLGATDGGLAAFRLTATLGDTAVAQLVAALFPDLADRLGDVEMHVTDVIETVTDPDTLRPSSAFHERRMQLDDGIAPIEEFERRTTQFDWDAGTCD